MSAKYIERTVQIPYGEKVPVKGDTVCLVEYNRLIPAYGRPKHWYELTTVPRTNDSRETLWTGWLGETNRVDAVALGPWRVVSIAEAGERTMDQAYFVRLADDAVVPEENVEDDGPCGRKNVDGVRCTRSVGHPGNHVAVVNGPER